MAYQRDEFRRYFLAKVGQTNSANNYRWSLDRIDEASGGLDAKIAELGHSGIMAWARSQTGEVFEGRYGSSARSALKRYLQFTLEDGAEDEGLDDEAEVAEAIVETRQARQTLFQYESELQVAVRHDISDLVPGLVIADGGFEQTVATGRTDILARDAEGRPVVVELKVGECPRGAIEQVLGYAHDVAEKTGGPVVSILIAGSFSSRLRAAAKRIPDLKLITYRMRVDFSHVD